MKTDGRKEVAEKIKIARSFGDLKENAEYDEAKKEQAFIEGEIIRIEKLIKEAEIIDESTLSDDVVNIGSYVKVYDYDLEDYVENIIEESMINEIIQDRLRCCGWQNIACMLDKVNYLDDDYYFMNGYGNLEELTISHLECIFSDMVEALNRIEE